MDRNNVATHCHIIDCDSEYILWLAIDKHFTHNDEDVLIGAIYLPVENSRFLNEDYFTDSENEIELKSSLYKYVFLVGATNGRTGRLKDFIQTDNYLNET